MKNFTKLAMTLLAVGAFTGNAFAKDVYISTEGSDSNDGLTAATAIKSLIKLGDVVGRGDVIHVSGMVDMKAEYDASVAAGKHLQRNTGYFYNHENGKFVVFALQITDDKWADLTFVGEDPETDGFDSKEAVGSFEFGRAEAWRSGENNCHTTFKNLGFVNGLVGLDGGAMWIHDHALVNFEGCVFKNNHYDWAKLQAANEDGFDLWKANSTPERGGAIHFQFGIANFKGCTFAENHGRMGSAICQTGGTLTIDDCLFADNGQPYQDKYLKDTRGGALCIWTLHTSTVCNINRSAFVGNMAYNDGGAILVRSNVDDNFDRKISLNINSCYFALNECTWEHGGAISIQNNDGMDGDKDGSRLNYINITNTTFYANSCGFYGAAIFLHGGLPGSHLYLTNCTMTGNTGINRNTGGHGANLSLGGDNNKNTLSPDNYDLRIANCVMEGNMNGNATPEYNDIAFIDGATGKNIKIYNSAVGRILLNDLSTLQNETNHIGYCGAQEYTGVLDQTTVNDFAYQGLTMMGKDWGAIPVDGLNENLPEADPTYFVEADKVIKNADETKQFTAYGYDITERDGCGIKRTDANKNIIGATVASADDLYEILDGENAGELSGIESVLGNVAEGLAIARDGQNFICEGAALTVYDVKGQKVAKANGAVSLSSLDKGIYIITAVKGAKHNVLKVAK